MRKIDLIAVGTRPPGWVAAGVAEYATRMGRLCAFNVIEIKTASRSKPRATKQYREQYRQQYREKEAQGMLAAVAESARVIAVDRAGKHWNTEKLAENLENWSRDTNHCQFLIGGPDGLSKHCLAAADDTFALSNLTFPHFMVRVLLAEQIYRALMINENHPYHK